MVISLGRVAGLRLAPRLAVEDFLMRSASSRLVVVPLALAVWFVTGCSLGSPSQGEDRADAAPIRVKTPGSSDKSGTSPSCGGITEHGVCENGQAVVCDVSTGELRRTDCAALGQRCIVDNAEGAICQAAGETCDSGLDFRGYCDGDVARWCDDEGDKSWNCASDGLSCATDVCEEGAFCCGAGGDAHPDCQRLGHYGECGGEGGQIARYCNGGDLIEIDCGSDASYSCQLDTCAEGAYCCPGNLECPALGFDGACAGDTVRYCNQSGEYHELDCTAFGMTCGTDCGDGADCCELDCDDVGTAGTCLGDWLVFCELGEIQKTNCPDEEPGTRCVPPGAESAFAHCG
jgi:hypothetical protein